VDARLRQPCPDARIVAVVEEGHKRFAFAFAQKKWGHLEAYLRIILFCKNL
jgi:hypothetical protein